jgi:hypothetical protein
MRTNDVSVVCSILEYFTCLICSYKLSTCLSVIVKHFSINIVPLCSTISGPGLPTTDCKMFTIYILCGSRL